MMDKHQRKQARKDRIRALHNWIEPVYDPSSDIFLAALDDNSVPPTIKQCSGYRKRTKIPRTMVPVHKDYTGPAFFKSKAWRQLRYLAIKVYGRKCMCCSSGEQIHVDHIKPRSRYPHIELDIRNLQILCEECNVGKGTWDMKDWRTDMQRLQADIVHSKKGKM
jgi:5-methylcytosine-specific restriction endonuclease McrA